jgi:uncharacterized protein YkwD
MSPRAWALLFAALVSGPALAQRPDLDAVEQLIVEATNEFRRGEGLRTVTTSPVLARTVRDFADFIARTDRYGHEADGKQPSDRARAHGYDYCLVSENIAYQYNSAGFRTAALARDFVEGWKQSPQHRKNMLEPDAVDTAVAVARSDRSGKYYAVQMFGRAKSSGCNG